MLKKTPSCISPIVEASIAAVLSWSVVGVTALLLSGCGGGNAELLEESQAEVRTLREDLASARALHATEAALRQEVESELKSTSTELADAILSQRQLEAQVEQLQSDLSKAQSLLAATRIELERFQNADKVEFQRLGALYEREEWEDSITGLRQFVRQYPQSSYLDEAQRLLTRAQAQQAKAAREARSREVAERAAAKQEAIETGAVTIEQLTQRLLYQPESELIRILGEPNAKYNNDRIWRYRDAVTRPESGLRSSIKVEVVNGVVQSLAYWGE